MKTKKCNTCKKDKHIDYFYKTKRGHDSNCIECKSEIARKAYFEKKNNFKDCHSCKKNLRLLAFKKTNGVYNDICKPCLNGEPMQLRFLNDNDYHIQLNKNKRKRYRKVETIFEEEYRLGKEAKELSVKEAKTDEWKLANGYRWITEEVYVTKSVKRKQRVLRKIK